MDEEAYWYEAADADNQERLDREHHDMLDREAEEEEHARMVRTIRIPAHPDHEGRYAVLATVLWVCPTCGGPRGEPFPSHSHDGSRRLHCHGWRNACGHVDMYADVVKEATDSRSCVPA